VTLAANNSELRVNRTQPLHDTVPKERQLLCAVEPSIGLDKSGDVEPYCLATFADERC
jgi:hypothetical protein